MTLACDIRIASEDARFSVRFTRLGITLDYGSSYFLPRLVGLGKALELTLTAKTIDAREAKEIGLVNAVVPANELAKATYEMAGSIAELPPWPCGSPRTPFIRGWIVISYPMAI